MAIGVACECGRYYETPAANAGKRAQCPQCGSVMRLPATAPAAETLYIGDVPDGRRPWSRGAAFSLACGLLFVFGCFSGVPAILLGWSALRDIRRGHGRLRGQDAAVAGIVLGVLGCLVTLMMLPTVLSAKEAARRAMCVNNLKQIGLAFHNYHMANGSFPPAAITDKDGKPLLSWRVAILPYLECSDLYSRFRLDEPWDSPHNRPLLDRLPYTYACPSDHDPQPGMTNYQVVVGPLTAFPPAFRRLVFAADLDEETPPPPVDDFPDGAGQTILVAETLRKVPWTKPEDLPFENSPAFAGLGSDHGYHNDGFNALFVDGSVRFLKSTINPAVLRALMTRDGSDPVSNDQY